MALTQVKTSGIADDAVTLAKQAGGTDGQIITFDASGNPTAVGPGTDGQVLTSTGAGSPPAFEAIAVTALNNATANEVVTVGSTTTELDAEANLTFDGSKLSINDATPDATLSVGGDTAFIDVGSAGGNRGKIGYASNSLYFGTSSGSGDFIFKNAVDSDVNPSGSGDERFKIDSSGNVYIGCTAELSNYESNKRKLSIFDSGSSGAYLELGGDQTADDYSAGTILFCNTNNSSSVRHVGMQRVEIVTSDNNAGDDSGGDLVFYTREEAGNINANFRIKSDRNVQITDGNLIVANGHGIDFSAQTQSSATTNHEVLDHYEEGYWTPSMTNGPTVGTTPVGRYTRIGDTVHAYFSFNFTGSDGTAAHAAISSLPFTSTNAGTSGNAIAGFAIEYSTCSGTDIPRLWIASNSTTSHLYNQVGAGLEGDHLDGKEFRGMLTYIAA